jgi:hypothetical protein
MKVHTGEVLVDFGKGYEIVKDEVLLQENSRIKTGVDGQASIVIYESLVHDVYPSSEVSLEELSAKSPKIQQLLGKTWSKFTALSGMKSFEVESSGHVALVRGTGYTVESYSVKVIDGLVEVRFKDNSTFIVQGGEAIENLDGNIWFKRNLTAKEKLELIEKLKSSVEMLKLVRQKLMNDNRVLFKIVQLTSGKSKEELLSYVEDSDRGTVNIDEAYSKSFVKNKVIERFADLSRVIQEENRLILSLAVVS